MHDTATLNPTCACDSSKDPTLAIADRATLCPLAQNIPAADPRSWINSICNLSPISHQHTTVIVTVDLWAQREVQESEENKQRARGSSVNERMEIRYNSYFVTIDC